jgi:D-alanyl-lipoteichoic acid acyltransferase DltB (MBOAT superfamily)
MLFTKFEFAVFLPVVFLIYWLAFREKVKARNLFLLFASYVFYGWWDWRFLLLLFSVSVFNYFTGILIHGRTDPAQKKIWLIMALVVNLGLLVFFKYFNFFIESFVDFISLFGYQIKGTSINLILPLGISFYTFLSVSYILDIYRGSLEPDRNIINVLLSLSFFPIILAGPIQRPATLLPQIRNARKFDYDQVSDGLRQILWGLFVKIAVADNLAPFADEIFAGFAGKPGSTLLAGALFYTVQIYADFSGYSHIAIGTANTLGIRLMQNFNYPYFSRDITEFWKRWHMSLTTWFRDYLFLPLSFSISWKIKKERVMLIKTDLFIYIIASLLTWFLTGLWHGANYTFLLWGLMHGFLLIIYHWQRKPRKRLFKRLDINGNGFLISFTEGLLTFFFVIVTWVIFRSDSAGSAFEYLGLIFSPSLFTSPGDLPLREIGIAIVFIIGEFIQKSKPHALHLEGIKSPLLRWGIYAMLVIIILFFGGGSQKFIYFQF